MEQTEIYQKIKNIVYYVKYELSKSNCNEIRIPTESREIISKEQPNSQTTQDSQEDNNMIQ